jgi:hypothetical protein
MTASSAKPSSAKPAKLRSGTRSRAEEATPEERLLRAIFGETKNSPQPTPLTVERARRDLALRAASAGEDEDNGTLEVIECLLDSLTTEISNLNQELSSSMERLAGKHTDGLGR